MESTVVTNTFRFTTTGGLLLLNRIAEIEKIATTDLQDGKSLDRTVTSAMVSLQAACGGARASLT